MTKLPTIIDGDGHVFEDLGAMWDLMDEPYKRDARTRTQPIFPTDHLHVPINNSPPGSFGFGTGPAEWLQFGKDLNLEATVLYPSAALAVGLVVNSNWATAAARAYNTWLHQTYLAKSPFFKAVACLPLQRPTDGAAELRRAVTELGMVGGVLPPTGLRGYVGDEEYWPVYEAADELGCTLAVHGGLHKDIGLNHMRTFAAVHGLGHPFGIMIAFASLVFNGVFDRFPNVRFAFMESGVAWVDLVIERLSGSSEGFKPWNPGAEHFSLSGKALRGYIIDLFRSGRAYVGVEGDEHALLNAIRTIGAQALVFSSDFPHEVNANTCRHEIEELLENDAVSDADKQAILYDNARKLYNLGAPAHAGSAR
jgi:predicted TIM-barrel fold metal-dependent hydrolase